MEHFRDETAIMAAGMAVIGNGNAEKEQVADMLKRMLHISPENMLPFSMPRTA